MNPEMMGSIAGIGAIAPLDGSSGNISHFSHFSNFSDVGNIGNIGNVGQTAASGGAGDSFGGWFAQQLNQVNGQLQTVDREMQTVALGGTQSLHQFMIHMEEAKLSFQLLAQVRNHLLESYQEVMRMQV